MYINLCLANGQFLRKDTMLVGYARISTVDQNLDLQIDALKSAGCGAIHKDAVSGARTQRPGLDKALSYLREGDTLVVWRLDRLGRSLRHLLDLATDLEKRKVSLRSLQESIDTSTAGGKLIFHVFGALAQFERELNRERTLAGQASARARGRRGGRKPLPQSKINTAVHLANTSTQTIEQICESMGISRSTFYRRSREEAS